MSNADLGAPPLYFCCDERRRDAVRGSATLNGIDYLEVVDHDAAAHADRQRFLRVHFVNPVTLDLAAANVRITGGERIRSVVVLAAVVGTGNEADVLTVEVEEPGDFSRYTLALVRGADDPAPPAGVDGQLARVEFSFKVECPADFDCAARRSCPPEARPAPEINYLAKDYASFRQGLFDRMALTLPDWRERNPADLGVTLVELLAYVGDQLSYQQDAVATEAYLDTARRRVSLRRHARLVDYFVHEGASARVWIQFTSAADGVVVPAGTAVFSRLDTRVPARIPQASHALDEALQQRPTIFETLHDATLFAAHNAMPFYTWGDRECCLPKGATRATLAGHYPNLVAGSVLIFEEARGPLTGELADADRARRHALRLTAVRAFDTADGPLTDPLTGQPVTAIEWTPEDALPFPFCLSGFTDEEHGAEFRDDLSVARGNVVLADHGWAVRDEPLGTVPSPTVLLPPEPGADRCHRSPPRFAPPRFRPTLGAGPLTHAVPHDPALPASASLRVRPADTLPAVHLQSTLGPDATVWQPQRDLLGSAPDAAEFVAETEADGTAYLRFGDDEHGRRPAPGTAFAATYRVGCGAAGNVGAETLAHVVSDEPAITGVRNPLPAAGGTDPETAAEVRRNAPVAFRTQRRAVTEADYAHVAETQDARVQRAAATLRWTGSWHTVFITADRFDGLPLTEAFEGVLRGEIEPFRLAGHDLEVDTPRYVSLELTLFVCVRPGYLRSDVRAALLDVFRSDTLPNGSRGVFHPDRFTFAQTVYLSPFVAAAQAVAGVASVEVKTFQRQGRPETSGLADGFLKLNRLEIARLDNDPNFLERGLFTLYLGGGR